MFADVLRRGIQLYTYIGMWTIYMQVTSVLDYVQVSIVEFAASAVAFLLVLLHFPSKPPVPPSISAGCERTGFVKGLKQLTG